MIQFSLNTFLKICLLDTGSRISEIQKRLSGPSGYDFYKPLQRAVRSHSSGDQKKAGQILASPTNDVERRYNLEAFKSFEHKFGTNRTLEPIKNPKQLKFPDAGLSVSIDPLFEVTKSGVRQFYCLWPTQRPELTQRYGALACYIMRQAYTNDGLSNGSFYFADLVANKVFSEKQITNNTNLILSADVNSIGTLLRQL